MEWISHGVTGALIGKSLVPADRQPRRAAVWWVAAALSPDVISVGTRYVGDMHRGVSHSLYVLPVLSLVWAVAAWRWGSARSGPFLRYYLAFLLIVGSHLLLDALTCYRYYPAWPFSRRAVIWSVMPMFDLSVFIGWAALLGARWLRPQRARLISVIGVFVMVASIGVHFLGKRAIAPLEQPLQGSSGLNATVQSIPDYWRPWIWYAHPDAQSSDWSPINLLSGTIDRTTTVSDPRRIGLGFGGL